MMFVASLRGLSRIGAGLMVRHDQTNRPTNGRLDKSAAIGSAHVVGFIRLFCQPAYTPCHLHAQESQQYQGLERRRLDAGFRS
jgi:hypothetical protein